MNQEELKTQIKKVMMDHLIALGYPNMDPSLIMKELKPMWLKLEEASLIQPGMNYVYFCQIANAVYQQTLLFNSLRSQFGR